MTQAIANHDTVTPFYFSDTDVRGAFVKLGNSFAEALNGHDYPAVIETLLGECLAAAVLMNTHVKQPTRTTVQARGHGSVNLLLAESVLALPIGKRQPDDTDSLHQTLRAFARYSETDEQASLRELLGKAQLAITLEPEEGQRYQGIVGLESESLEQCLANYFEQSEQLATCFRLGVADGFAAGLLIQRLPSNDRAHDQAHDTLWEELEMLTRSIKTRELTELPCQSVLHRLFHQHPHSIGAEQPVAFECSCSLQRTGEALLQVSPDEIEDILREDGEIIMDCEFCSARYRFDRQAVATLQQRNAIEH